MTSSRSVVFAEPVRTAIGAFGGSLKGIAAPDLGAAAIRAAVDRAGLEPHEIGTAVMGQACPSTKPLLAHAVVPRDAVLRRLHRARDRVPLRTAEGDPPRAAPGAERPHRRRCRHLARRPDDPALGTPGR